MGLFAIIIHLLAETLKVTLRRYLLISQVGLRLLQLPDSVEVGRI